MAGGGGGASGKVDFPTYMKNFHEEFLTNGGTPVCPTGYAMDELLAAALQANSPFYGQSAYDPTTDNANVQTRTTLYATEVDARNAESNWGDFVDNSVSKATTALPATGVDLTDVLASDAIANIGNQLANVADLGSIAEDASAAFEIRTVGRYRRSVAQFAAGMADINAVMSSAYIWGLAMLETERQQEINNYETQLENSARLNLIQVGVQAQLSAAAERLARRDNFVSQGAQIQASQDLAYLGERARSADLQYRVSMAKVASKVEQAARDVELDYLDATYDFTLFQFGGNFLASISGAPLIPKEPSKFQSVVGGALGGASAGAAIGGVPGAVIGGIAGTLLSIF